MFPENAYGEWSSDNFSVSLISSLMKSGHEKFMSERAPYDGHKQNIIDKSHNYAGIGFYLTKKQFRYYEEFIDRYFEFENIPSEVKAGDPCAITIKTDGQSFLYYVVIYRENWPHLLSTGTINKKGNYPDFTNQKYKEYLHGSFHVTGMALLIRSLLGLQRKDYIIFRSFRIKKS